MVLGPAFKKTRSPLRNALLIEEKYHLHERRADVQVNLPNGRVLEVRITFDYTEENHRQSTGSGLRSVSRISRDTVPPEGVDIPLYRRPEDGTIDSLRYRLEATEDRGALVLEQVGTLNAA